MFCHNCGEKSEDGARYCNECGTALVAAAVTPAAGAAVESAGAAAQVQPMAPAAAPVPASPPPTGAAKIAGDIALTPISVCAALLIFSFFMPWVTIEGLSVSGYKITELGELFNAEEIQIVWALPLLGAAALVAGLYRKQQWLAIPAGAASIGVFIYLIDIATEVESKFNNVGSGFGFWLMLAMGVALVALGFRELLIMRSDRGQKVLWVMTGCLALVAVSSILAPSGDISIDPFANGGGLYFLVVNLPLLTAILCVMIGTAFLTGPRKYVDGSLLVATGVFIVSIIASGHFYMIQFRMFAIVASITSVLVFLRQRRQAAS